VDLWLNPCLSVVKKESLEKIAETFWGRPEKKKRKNFKVFFLIIFIFLCIIGYLLLPHPPLKLKPETKILTFDLGREIIRINYNFSDTDLKTEKYTLDLGNLNLNEFKRLELSCRKAKSKGEVSLKLELENSLKEKSHFYLSGIKNRWQNLGIDLSEFKEIKDWSNIKNLSFIIEEWNTQEKTDTVYIDEIRFFK